MSVALFLAQPALKAIEASSKLSKLSQSCKYHKNRANTVKSITVSGVLAIMTEFCVANFPQIPS